MTVMKMDFKTEQAKMVKAAGEVTRKPQSLFAGHPL
jgi:hypothetical protein